VVAPSRERQIAADHQDERGKAHLLPEVTAAGDTGGGQWNKAAAAGASSVAEAEEWYEGGASRIGSGSLTRARKRQGISQAVAGPD
jgi:hypothetical protein